MRKKVKFSAIGLLFGAVAAFGMPAYGQQQAGSVAASLEDWEGVTLRFAQHYPQTHLYTTEGAEYFMQRVTELSGEKIKFEFYPGQQLGKAPDHLNLARTGVADITGIVPNYTPGEMPLSGVMELPGVYPNSTIGTKAYWELTQDGPVAEEFAQHNVRPLWVLALSPYLVSTNQKQVRLPEDIQGLKIRVTGDSRVRAIRALGAIPVNIPITETRDALDRGTVDGTVDSPNGLVAYSLYEVEKHATVGAGVGATMTAWVINKDAWQKLPGAAQRVIAEVGLETGLRLAQLLDDNEHEIYEQKLKPAGVEMTFLTMEERMVWKQALMEVEAEWVEAIAAKGLPAEAVIDQRDEIMAALPTE